VTESLFEHRTKPRTASALLIAFCAMSGIRERHENHADDCPKRSQRGVHSTQINGRAYSRLGGSETLPNWTYCRHHTAEGKTSAITEPTAKKTTKNMRVPSKAHPSAFHPFEGSRSG
jgi:hypothetical protein